MGMTIDEIIQGLKETIIVCNSVFAYDRKKYIDVAIDRLSKYQQLQADYENRLKADMVAEFEELKAEIEELDTPNNSDAYMTCAEVIQQKINALKKEAEDGKAD